MHSTRTHADDRETLFGTELHQSPTFTQADGEHVNALIRADAALLDKDIRALVRDLRASVQAGGEGAELIDEAGEHGLMAPIERALLGTGKRLRPLWTYWTVRNYQAEPRSTGGHGSIARRFRRIAVVIEALHAASLVIDDWEDGAGERRGGQPIYLDHGAPIAVNAASWLFFAAVGHLSTAADREVAIRLLRLAHIGQGLDLSLQSPRIIKAIFLGSAEARWRLYERIAKLKTAVLFKLAVQHPARLLGAGEAEIQTLMHSMEDLGLAIQIVNDLKHFDREGRAVGTFEWSNLCTLRLIDRLEEEERREMWSQYTSTGSTQALRQHPALADAVHETRRFAESLTASAEAGIAPLCRNVSTRAYLAGLLSRGVRA